MFEKDSRYAGSQTYLVQDARGRSVAVVDTPDRLEQPLRGVHLRKQGQRIDHLAYHYMRMPTGFWRIAEMNRVMLVETLTEASEIAIPKK